MAKYGLFTPYTLRFHSDLYNEPASNLLKRSLILFDNNVYLEPRKQDVGFVEQMIGETTDEEKKEISEFFKPVSEFVNEELMDNLRFTVNPETNLWYGPHGQEFGLFMKNFITKRFGFDAFNYKDAKEFEIVDFYITAMSADFNFLLNISNHDSEISALFTELHRDSYFATFQNNTSTPERVLEKVCSVNYFDFAKLSWSELLELKRSHFLNDFRIKFYEWLADFEKTNDTKTFESNLASYIRSSQFKFLEDNRPTLIENTAMGVLGNLPIFPGLNPFSIYSSFIGVRSDLLKRSNYGWLFFIQEAYQKYEKIIKE
ncbi:ABC-type amino acid transport substrate-binding protein [Mucilaginibacter yixingensis]|uniref:ABC-type amino acid transport substrate-binding protein n=1 Tax=Mucilaginibacter yixingensis TaxID=1295612 RepID=A0A2T5J4C6_9SPHI|nr:hypothetical protein [Mucilaginibacter yixingensis]PTQ92126.1 ABC-type amino acid transport substrate-binding protein [Mucilaginibacter yixingensis]